MIATFSRFKPFLAALVICATGALLGCDESPPAAESVDQAQRLMRASRQHINMTGAEMESAGSLTPARESSPQTRRLGRSVAERILAEQDQQLEQIIAEIDQLEQTLATGDDAALNLMTQKVLLASRQMSLLADNVDSIKSPDNAQRLEAAARKLRDAIADAGKDGKPKDQLGPELANATLQLMLGRRHRTRLDRQELVGIALQIAIGRITFPIISEQTHHRQLDEYRPDATITVLTDRLQGGADAEVAGLREQLAVASERVEQLETQQREIQQDIESHTVKAAQMQRQYLSLLDQAQKLPPLQRYEVQKQAYDVRGGAGDSEGNNGIYYEVQAELAENDLAVVNSRLMIARLQQEQLALLTSQTEQDLAAYSESSVFEQLDQARRQSVLQREQLVARLGKLLEDLITAEQDYSALRVEAVAAYRDAISGYQTVSDLSGRDKNGQYARDLMKLVRAELAALWNSDAQHYQTTSAALATLDNIRALTGTVSQMRQNADDMAIQAKASAADLSDESNSTDY